MFIGDYPSFQEAVPIDASKADVTFDKYTTLAGLLILGPGNLVFQAVGTDDERTIAFPVADEAKGGITTAYPFLFPIQVKRIDTDTTCELFGLR